MSIEQVDRPEFGSGPSPAESLNPRVIVMGASAGGLTVLQNIIAALPKPFDAVVCVVVHTPAWRRSLLPAALSVDGSVAIEPVNHQPLAPGRVYVAAPDHHLIVEHDEAVLWHGPKENSHRPAVNA